MERKEIVAKLLPPIGMTKQLEHHGQFQCHNLPSDEICLAVSAHNNPPPPPPPNNKKITKFVEWIP